MKSLLVAIVLLSASTGFSAEAKFVWNKSLVAQLKTNSLQDVFCKSPNGPSVLETCKYISAQKRSLNSKIKTIEIENPSTVRVSDGRRSVEITRGAKVSQFIINKKTIDFAELKTVQERYQKIAELMPKVAASFFFPNAQAAEGKSDIAEMNDALVLMMSQSVDIDICDSAKRVVALCEGTNRDDGAGLTGGYMAAVKKYKELIQNPSAEVADVIDAVNNAVAYGKKVDEELKTAESLVANAPDKVNNLCSVKSGSESRPAREALETCKDKVTTDLLDVRIQRIEINKQQKQLLELVENYIKENNLKAGGSGSEKPAPKNQR
jgi:hypothetical protein